jgi:hypothetical protein
MKVGVLKSEEIIAVSDTSPYNYITKAHEIIKTQRVDFATGKCEALEEFYFKRSFIEAFLFNNLLICQEKDEKTVKVQLINLHTADTEAGWDKKDLTKAIYKKWL